MSEEKVSETFKEEIEKTFQSIYNQAVGDCIKVVNGWYDGSGDSMETDSTLTSIISNLQKLKHQ